MIFWNTEGCLHKTENCKKRLHWDGIGPFVRTLYSKVLTSSIPLARSKNPEQVLCIGVGLLEQLMFTECLLCREASLGSTCHPSYCACCSVYMNSLIHVTTLWGRCCPSPRGRAGEDEAAPGQDTDHESRATQAGSGGAVIGTRTLWLETLNT